MKKYLLLLLFPFAVAYSQSPVKKEYIERSEKIFTDIRNREFAKVTAEFDTSISSRIDTARLRRVWDNIIKIAGPFVSVINTPTDHQPTYDVVIQHCQFEKKKIDFKLVFGSRGKVNGISFLPGEPKDQYKLPVYYKPELITERVMAIQNGPYRLPGVLTTPKKPGRFPVVILIHGSGPNDKDETVGPMKIFKDISLGLAYNGIAVYRYDKRSRVYAAKVAKDKKLTVNEETIEDAIAAINMLKADSTVDSTQIYLCGHSLGGMLLPRIATQVSGLKGLIYLAANARKLEDVLYDQTKYLMSVEGDKKDSQAFLDSIRNETTKIKELKQADDDTSLFFHIPVSYWVDLNNYNQVKTAAGLNLPMFFLQGGRDYQITETDLNMWKNGLKNSNIKFKIYPSLNHFFITGEGKSSPGEYIKSGNVDIEVINDISSWILSGKK